MGFDIVAVNLLELAVSPGLAAVAAAGGLAAFTGWDRGICGVVLADETRSPSAPGDRDGEGWRARRLPTLVGGADDELTVRSSIDGSIHRLRTSELLATGARLGASAPSEIVPAGLALAWWRRVSEPPPAAGWVVGSVPADAAREGLYWAGTGWASIGATIDAASPGTLALGCACRACEISTIGYLAHLWRQREITASHLLGWHNLHQARGMLQGT